MIITYGRKPKRLSPTITYDDKGQPVKEQDKDR